MASKGISLHIGVNHVDPDHYQGWDGRLAACEFDSEAMSEIAQKRGFETHTLNTTEATRDAVVDAIRNAAQSLHEGDIFWVSYAGHGGQVADTNNDEADMTDETWCLFDGQLIDDELWHLWSTFHAGARILVVSDSCHSGTVIRTLGTTVTRKKVLRSIDSESALQAGLRYRLMPRDCAAKVYRAHREFYGEIQRLDAPSFEKCRATVRLISACQDSQVAADGAFNGLFTAKLLHAWGDGTFRGTYDDLHNALKDSMPTRQQPNHIVHGALNEGFDNEPVFSV